MYINKTHVILINVSFEFTKMYSLYHHSYMCPYNKTIINFHGGKYRVILTSYS